MKIKARKLLTIFDRAYDKAAEMKPQGPNPLKPVEEEVLRKFLYNNLGYKLRKKGKK